MRAFTAALDVTDLARAGAWLDRVAAIIPAEAKDERVMLAECYERLGRNRADQAVVDQMRVDQGTKMVRELASEPDAAVTTLLTAAAQAERNGKDAERRAAQAERERDVAKRDAAKAQQTAEQQLAEKFYRAALAKDPNLWLAQNNLAMLLVHRDGDLAEALRLAKAAAKLQPANPAVLDTLAQVQAKLRDYTSAIETVRHAILLEPDQGKWRIRLAQYQMAAGDIVEAAKTVAVVDDRRLQSGLSQEMQAQLTTLREQIRPTRPRVGNDQPKG